MNWKEAKKTIASNPEVKLALEENAVEYQIIRQVLQTRRDLKITQKQLADLAMTKQANIARLENGHANPSIKFLDKLAKSTGRRLEIRFV